MSKEKNLGEFIQTVNKEVISTIISKQTNPLKPDKQFTCHQFLTLINFK